MYALAYIYYICNMHILILSVNSLWPGLSVLAGRYVIISLKAGYFFMGRKSHIAFSPSQSLAPSFAFLIARYSLRTFPEAAVIPFIPVEHFHKLGIHSFQWNIPISWNTIHNCGTFPEAGMPFIPVEHSLKLEYHSFLWNIPSSWNTINSCETFPENTGVEFKWWRHPTYHVSCQV